MENILKYLNALMVQVTQNGGRVSIAMNVNVLLVENLQEMVSLSLKQTRLKQ